MKIIIFVLILYQSLSAQNVFLDYFEEKTLELIEAGVSIIGGCCGTTPEHIRAIRKVVDSNIRAKG